MTNKPSPNNNNNNNNNNNINNKNYSFFEFLLAANIVYPEVNEIT